MRLREAALAVADPDGPLPVTHTGGVPVAAADARGLRMVRLARDLMTQLRNAGIVGTASVHANQDTTRRGTRSIVLRIAPAGAPTAFEIAPSYMGITRRGTLRSITGDPYGHLRTPGGPWTQISLNHGCERLNIELAQALSCTLAMKVWDHVLRAETGRVVVRLDEAWFEAGVVVLMLDGPLGRIRVCLTPQGCIASILSIDRSGAVIRTDGAYRDYLAGRLADALGGTTDILRQFGGALTDAVRAHLPTLPKDVPGFELD